MPRLCSWLLVLLLFGAFVGVAAYVLQARTRAGKGLPPYSVYSEERDGLGPAARLLEQLGFKPMAVMRPIGHTRHQGLLIMAEPMGNPSLEEGDDWPDAEVR